MSKHIEREIKAGDNVVYSYTHHLNSKSSILVEKKGVVLRSVQSKNNHYCKRRTDFVMVQVAGNKKPSKIHLSQLTLKP